MLNIGCSDQWASIIFQPFSSAFVYWSKYHPCNPFGVEMAIQPPWDLANVNPAEAHMLSIQVIAATSSIISKLIVSPRQASGLFASANIVLPLDSSKDSLASFPFI